MLQEVDDETPRYDVPTAPLETDSPAVESTRAPGSAKSPPLPLSSSSRLPSDRTSSARRQGMSLPALVDPAVAAAESEEMSQRFRYLGESRREPVPSPSVGNFSATGTPLAAAVERATFHSSRAAEAAAAADAEAEAAAAAEQRREESQAAAFRSRRMSCPAATTDDAPLIQADEVHSGFATARKPEGLVSPASSSGSSAPRGRRHSLKAVVNRIRFIRRSLTGIMGKNAWARTTVATKLGDEEDEDGPLTSTAAGSGVSRELATTIAMVAASSAADDVGPEVMVDPTAAAVFSCIPSAVEQWVVQQWSFRVLFMDAVLLRTAAEEFGCEDDVQVGEEGGEGREHCAGAAFDGELGASPM